ncbi:hypothetical protein HY498_00785 [Candidatus Woesearchaeota archaeon]|nr:hypothetical protein [Candidatus Woesearchaeota archaeon]
MITTRRKNETEIIKLDIPIPEFSILSHLENIVYCIKQISNFRSVKELVVGYIIQRSQRVIETDHKLMPKKSANIIKARSSRFDYITLEELLRAQNDIKKGKYILHEGLIVDFNPKYKE